MKTKESNVKLQLNKKTIASLDEKKLNEVKGGYSGIQSCLHTNCIAPLSVCVCIS
jgi:hypothetical protein